MSTRRAGSRLLMTLAASALIAACSTPPIKPSPQPATVIAQPAAPPVVLASIAPAPVRNEPWDSLTASFALEDCTDSPLVRTREAMYTRSPMHFEQLLRHSLPLMMYVHKQLQAAGIPGEFAMLPMLESSYTPHEPSRRGDAAGMWQLMPATARMHGIVVNRHYDGRLDPVASTRVALKMLVAFNQQFGDWRLADMAYNAGPGAVANALRRHADVADSGIPDIPVSATTRNHLAKLMALACILREPQRFHVALPQPSGNDELTTLKVPAGTRFAAAAEMAEIPEATLRALNPGYRSNSVPADSPRELLLPANAAQSLAAALAVGSSESIAQVSGSGRRASRNDSIPLPLEPTPPPVIATPAAAPATRHRVRQGETLWSISRHYDVDVGDLKRWNHLRGDTVHPGELLQIRG